MRTLAVLLLLIALTAIAAAGQPQQPVFRGGVEVLEVDVTVVDGRGQPVTDLRSPEFTVTVDGRPRQVLSSEFVLLRSKEAVRAPRTDTADPTISSNANAPRGRLIVIGVDREGIQFGSGRLAMRSAMKFLDKLGPRDKVALVTVPPPGPSADFTTNHQAVRQQLERTAGEASRPKTSMEIGVYEAFAIDRHTDRVTEMAVMQRLCGQLQGMAAQQCQLQVRAQSGVIAQEVQRRVDNALRGLRDLLLALRDIEGPKSLVWISEGLAIENAGIGELSDIGAMAAAARTTVSVVLLDAPETDVSERTPSPCARQDRDMAINGMEQLAALTGGAPLRVSSGADFVFDRLENETSGYYLLAVESAPVDKDGKRHPIKVNVGRRGLTVRARQEFGVGSASASKRSPEERVLRALSSPFSATDFPVRLTTYAYQDTNVAKVRLVVASEMGPSDQTPSDVTLAVELLDADGRSTLSKPQQAKLNPVTTTSGTVFQHVTSLAVDPGEYTVKLAVVDDKGRRASVEHPVKAWQMADVPFAVSDLTVSDAQTAGNAVDRLQTVESRLAGGQLLAYLELYSNERDYLTDASVKVEVASEESSPALAAAAAELKPFGEGNRQVAAVVPIDALPPGRYVARAMVTRGSSTLGRLVRPFERLGGNKTVAPPLSALLSAPAAFDRSAVLTPAALGYFMDVLDKGRPALKTVTSQVRSGRLDGAARAALDADDQLAAMFLRGLELFAKGDFNQAATQLSNAQRLAPDFTPASFYLGACYAAAGNDREAANVWLKTVGGGSKSAVEIVALGDALRRLGQHGDAVEPLTRAVSAFPADDGLRRNLAVAYALGQRERDAVVTIERYLARHADDQEALLVAMHGIYAAHLAGQSVFGTDEDRTRMTTWSRAYAATKGAQRSVVDLWVSYVAAH